ncbi:MAG: putative Chase2 sensor protein [Thermoleophilia bacterium]|nr:putative Chase2 sensor protein [Thermoleophilia bacterium]
MIAVVGLAALAYATQRVIADRGDASAYVMAAILLAASLVCSRFPLRFGIGETMISLDSVPLVLAVVLLEPGLAMWVGAITVMLALWGQPPLVPGWRGHYWRVASTSSSALSIGLVGWISRDVIEVVSVDQVVLLVPAFVTAVMLEIAFDAMVCLEIEATTPGVALGWLRHTYIPMSTNILLPAFATAVLTPYVSDLWQFAVLLPILLVGMYGALWVANSQQREKRRGDRLKDTFSRYVPEGIVNDNIETMQEIELGGEQQDISVLFCDIRGFTSWSEDKGAKEVITELNVLLSELSASVMGTGGTLDKFTGDGLMAFWGAPVPVEDHADRAARAALDMLERLHAVNERRAEEGQSPFAIGVAVHSGPAVVGNVGHERRLDYTAIGDTVNTTARLESSTKELGAVLLVSRSTVDRLGEELRERAMLVGDVTMKGKSRVVEAWALPPMRPELDGVDDEFAA